MLETNYWLRRRISRRVLVGTGSAGLIGAGLVACGGKSKNVASGTGAGSQSGTQGAQGEPQSGGTYKLTYPANAPLDPQKVSAAPQFVVGGVYSRVSRFKTGLDPTTSFDHNVESDLGTSVESPDAITWTVKLRPDAKFTNTPPVNGHAVEAEDIKATFTRILDPATSSPNRGQVSMIDPTQIQTPDKQTVVFKLKYPYAPFNRTLASPTYSLILPREALAGTYDPSKVAIGSGPFTLESFQPDVAYTYKKNPDWFQKGQPYIDAIEMPIVPDAAQQLAQWTAGKIDEYTAPLLSVDAAKRANPKANVLEIKLGSPQPIVWQMGDPTSPFQDIRVRRAFSMAIDRDTLTKTVYNGEAVPVVFIPGYMGKWSLPVSGLAPDVQQYYKYNPSEAKKLLEAAGATDLQIRFAMVINGPSGFVPSPDYKADIEAINNWWNAVGIKSNIITIDYNKDYIDSGKGSSQGFYPKDMVIFAGFSGYSEADEWLFSYWDSKSVNSHSNLKDPAVDAMIDKERALVDEAERLKAVLDIQRYIADKMYFLSTVGPTQVTLTQPRVRNYQFMNGQGTMTETYSKVWLSA